METKYFECHITIEPVFAEQLLLFQEICGEYGFRVADLFMQRDREDTPERSSKDTFCTGRDKDYRGIEVRMHRLVAQLRDHDFDVWRQKIEAVVLDERLESPGGGIGRRASLRS